VRYQLHLAERIEHELNEALAWSRQHHPTSTRAFRSQLSGIFAELRETPLLWAVWRPPNLRRRLLPRFPYVVVYRVEADAVTIVGIWHQHSDLTRHFPQVHDDEETETP